MPDLIDRSVIECIDVTTTRYSAGNTTSPWEERFIAIACAS